MCTGFIVKNTFICEPTPPALLCCRRAYSLNDLTVDKRGALLEWQPLEHVASTVADSDSDREGDSESEGAVACAQPPDVGDLDRALRAGGALAAAAVAQVCSVAGVLSFDVVGCSVVQRALEVASPQEARAIFAKLHGMMASAARSSHASSVLESSIHVLGREAASCIAGELQGQGHALAVSMHGISVICRLLEHAASAPEVVALVQEVLAEDVAGLCCHKFGHEVAVAIVSNGLKEQRAAVLLALLSDVQRFARHRFAARVVEQALLQCPEGESSVLAKELMGVAGAVTKLACHSFGLRVVRALLELPAAAAQAVPSIVKNQHKLRKDKYGMELLGGLGLGREACCKTDAPRGYGSGL